jgi:Ser-tRNA(Ala) deacylase AlaX
MQEGFEISMGGDPFKTEEENITKSIQEHNESIRRNTEIIEALIKQARREERFRVVELFKALVVDEYENLIPVNSNDVSDLIDLISREK